MKTEAAVIVSAVTAFFTAAVGLGLAFGLDISQEQQDAMLKMLAAMVALIAAIGPIIRPFVWSQKSVEKMVDTAEQAGQTNSPAPPVVP